MLSKENYQKLKKSFGKYGSWAIWDQQRDSSKPKSNIDGMEWAKEPLHEKLNGNYVFVGLNSSVHDNHNVETWSAFHSSDIKRSRDHRIRNALISTKFWGSYMTDIIKDYPETKLDTTKLNNDIIEKNKKAFEKELSFLSEDVKIIAFGEKVSNILDKMGFGNRVVKIPHFSCRFSNDEFAKKVKDVLKSI